MTIQSRDVLIVEDQQRTIAAAAPIPFIPRDYGLRYGGMWSTGCYRGFWVKYALHAHDLSIDELQLVAHPQDLKPLLQGQLFARLPTKVQGNFISYEQIEFPYTGQLLLELELSVLKLNPSKTAKELFIFSSGKLISRQLLQKDETPPDLIAAVNWVEYGHFYWKLEAPTSPDFSILSEPLELLRKQIDEELTNDT